MDMDDKNRFERITETLGEHCGIVELFHNTKKTTRCGGPWPPRVRWMAARDWIPDVTRTCRCAGRDMILVASEPKVAVLHAGAWPHHARRRGNHGARSQAALAELTDAISARDRVRACCSMACSTAPMLKMQQTMAISTLARTCRCQILEHQRLPAPSGRHCGRVSACRPSPPTISSARRAATRAAASLARAIRLVARADRELRPRRLTRALVLERLVYDLALEPKAAQPAVGRIAALVRG